MFGGLLEALGGVFDRDRVADPTDAFEFQRFGGGGGEVPGAAFDVGAAVDHRGDDRATVPDELDRRATGKRLVGDTDRRRAERLPAGGRAPPHADAAVPAGAGVAKRGEGEFGFVEGRGRFSAFSRDRRGAGGTAGRGPGARRADERDDREGEAEGCQQAGFPHAALRGVVHVSFGTLTGLADGLALKELRYTGRRRRFAPTKWVPRSPRYVGEDSARSWRQISKR